MFDRELTLFAFCRAYLQKLAGDLTDDQLTLRPVPGLNPPAWLLGHLAIANDHTLRMLGRPNVCPRAWHVDFGPGSTPLKYKGAAPAKRELLDAFETGYQQITEAAKAPDPVKMAAPNPVEFIRRPIPTVGDLVAHLLSTHIAGHVGQLSAWRKAAGLPAIDFAF
jgi:hypothetical protein